MFGLGNKKKAITRDEALAARPVQLVKPEIVDLPDGGAKLKVKLKPAKWAGAVFRMPEGTVKTFELEPIGLFLWNLCDGKHTVQQIVAKMAKEYRLSMREMEVSTIQFLNMLTRKGLIGMSVEKK